MKLKILGMVVILGLAAVNLTADELKLPKCNNKSTCVNDKEFYVEVKRVVRRGDVVIVQLEYTAKRNIYIGFSTLTFKGYAMILDAKGEEFKIEGKEISNFGINKGQNKVVSFRFKGNEKKKIIEPFDLTIRTNDGEITLFDLKQESRFREVTSPVSQKE